MVDTEEAPPVASGDEIKPYKVHVSRLHQQHFFCSRWPRQAANATRAQVSSRYLDLTRQKLELTRLPHESTQPPSEDWWEPKPQVEPLIDFW